MRPNHDSDKQRLALLEVIMREAHGLVRALVGAPLSSPALSSAAALHAALDDLQAVADPARRRLLLEATADLSLELLLALRDGAELGRLGLEAIEALAKALRASGLPLDALEPDDALVRVFLAARGRCSRCWSALAFLEHENPNSRSGWVVLPNEAGALCIVCVWCAMPSA